MRNDVNVPTTGFTTDSPWRRPLVSRQCPICKRLRCPLKSHAAFAKRVVQDHTQQHNGRLHQIDDQKADPFAKHPIPMTSELELLYAQGWRKWSTDFQGPERHMFPFSRYSAVFRSGWNDEALHYGMLSLLATQVSRLRSGTIDELALRLQLRAVTAQRKAVARGEISDSRVLTALCIMSNALAVNNATDLRTHLSLIEAWVRKQGGLQYLGMEGVVADNLMYGDHLRAIMHNEEMHYTMMMPPVASTSAPAPTAAYTELHLRGLISEEVAAVASNYLVLVQIFDRAAMKKGTASEASYFAYLANVVEWQLAQSNYRFHDTNSLDEAIILACLVGNHSLLRNYGSLAPGISVIEDRLWRCMGQLTAKRCFEPQGLDDLRCYLGCVGCMTSVRRRSPNEERTVETLAQVIGMKAWPVHAFHELCDIMERYGWSQSVCLTTYARLWNMSNDLLGGAKVKAEMEVGPIPGMPLRQR